ncbi:MAG: N-acyl-D-amino-acid deacylase family protein, partial [Limisphaerales bacterium]
MSRLILVVVAFALATHGIAAEEPKYDVVIRNGTIYDGTGGKHFVGDVAIKNDSIASIGKVSGKGRTEIDATDLAVAPGFINMLSWAQDTLLYDGRSQSDIRQGVTLEVFGEGDSPGPLNAAMKRDEMLGQKDIHYKIEWTTLGQFLDYLSQRGISPNVASFVGATTLRIHEVGYENRPPTPEEMNRMRALVRQAMEEGALGVGSSLIYAPAFFAKTDELIELCKVASKYGGNYISHMRSEGNQLLEATDELITISRAAHIPAEIYHLKAAGQKNWGKMDALIAKIEAARKSGLKITADMYTYTAAETGLDAAMPPWVQEGGLSEWIKRLRDPEIRKRVKSEMDTPSDKWENFFLAAGSPDKIILCGFKNTNLKPLTGKTLTEVAKLRGTSPEDTAMDLVIEDGSRVDTVYFLMDEKNVRKELQIPWISFGSDAGSMAPEGAFLKSHPHPRAYGNFARVLGKYSRDEHLLTLEQAVHRLSGLPADNLHLKKRGLLKRGYFADVVVFDPAHIQDHATYENPQQFATGVQQVFVNGIQVVRNSEHTGAMPGR